MISLRDWLSRHAHRPILIAIFSVSALQVVGVGLLTKLEWEARRDAADHTADAVTLGIQQQNRTLVESALMGGLHAARFSWVDLCRDETPELSYPPSPHAACGRSAWVGRTLVARRALVGAPGYRLDIGFDVSALLAPALLLISISAALFLAVAVLLHRARLKFVEEILDPLMTGLNSKRILAISELDELRRKNLEHQELRRSEALMHLSAQVAHDIRAPLASLKSLSGPDDESHALFAASVDRISAIADGLLAGQRSGSLQVSAVPLLLTIRPVLAEAASCKNPGTNLSFPPEDGPDPLVRASPAHLQRITSNLLGNAIEAARKSVRVSIDAGDGDRPPRLVVTDDGPGISPDILPKLGQRGATFGKKSGTGLGLWHAKTTVESWGGRLEIESEVGKGTTVRLILPRADAPDDAGPAVLIDDDPLVRLTWTTAANRAGVELRVFPDTPSFIKEADGLPRDTPIYLDSDLGEGVKGEDAARELAAMGFTHLTLETGHDPASFPFLPHLKAVRGKEPPWTTA